MVQTPPSADVLLVSVLSLMQRSKAPLRNLCLTEDEKPLWWPIEGEWGVVVWETRCIRRMLGSGAAAQQISRVLKWII